jgi:hypothetical protein
MSNKRFSASVTIINLAGRPLCRPTAPRHRRLQVLARAQNSTNDEHHAALLKNYTYYGQHIDIFRLSRDLHDREDCLPAEAEFLADLVLERNDFKNAPLTETAGISIYIWKNGGYVTSLRLTWVMLETFRNIQKYLKLESHILTLQQAATLSMLSCKLVWKAADWPHIVSDVLDICEVRDFLFFAFEFELGLAFIELTTAKEGKIVDEKLAAIVSALKMFKTGNYHHFPQEQVDELIEDLKPGYRRKFQTSPAKYMYVTEGIPQKQMFFPFSAKSVKYDSYSNILSTICINWIDNMSGTPDRRQRALHVAKALIKKAGMDVLVPVAASLEEAIRNDIRIKREEEKEQKKEKREVKKLQRSV